MYAQTARDQFNAIAPRKLSIGGRTYTRKGPDLLVDDCTFRAAFSAPKRAGDLIPSKIDAEVRYLPGPDAYLVVLRHVDGQTLDTTEVGRVDGWHFDDFDRLQVLIDVAVRRAGAA